MADDDPLRRAVTRLVSPHREPTLQRSGLDLRVTVVTHPGLLQQLRGAVIGGVGSHGSPTGGNDSSRLPFDPGAAGLLERIERTLARWVGSLGYRPFKGEPERTIVAWFREHEALYLAGRIDVEVHGRRVARLLQWGDEIEDLFNPPEQTPLGAECPACHQRWGETQIGDRVDALVVEYRRAGDRIGDVRATCRGKGCGAEWLGSDGVRDLVAAIEDRERAAEEHLADQLETAHPDTGPVTVIA